MKDRTFETASRDRICSSLTEDRARFTKKGLYNARILELVRRYQLSSDPPSCHLAAPTAE